MAVTIGFNLQFMNDGDVSMKIKIQIKWNKSNKRHELVIFFNCIQEYNSSGIHQNQN